MEREKGGSGRLQTATFCSELSDFVYEGESEQRNPKGTDGKWSVTRTKLNVPFVLTAEIITLFRGTRNKGLIGYI